jgi:hypothetical protein
MITKMNVIYVKKYNVYKTLLDKWFESTRNLRHITALESGLRKCLANGVMPIIIILPNNKEKEIKVSVDNTVEEVGAMIGFRSGQLHFKYNDKILWLDRTLSDYNIGRGFVLNVSLSL